MKLFIKVILITFLYNLSVRAREGYNNNLIFFIRGQKNLSNYWINDDNKSSEGSKIILQNSEVYNDTVVEKNNPLVIYLPGKKDEVYSKISFSLSKDSKLNDLSSFQRFISEIKLVAPSAEELISQGYDCSSIGLTCDDLNSYNFTADADEWLSKVDLKLFIESDVSNNSEDIEEQEKELFQYEIKNNYDLGNTWSKFIGNIDKSEINVEDVIYSDFVFKNYGSMPVYVYVGNTIFLKRDLRSNSKHVNDFILEKASKFRLKMDTMGNRIINKNPNKHNTKFKRDENIPLNNIFESKNSVKDTRANDCDKIYELYPEAYCDKNNRGKIVYLEFYNTTLSYDDLDYIFGITSLETLILDTNQIVSIPPSIGNLSYLSMLRIKNNLIGSLPEEMGKLSQLQILDLYGNNLSISIPEFIEKLTNLITLDMGWNYLTGDIPEFIGKLSKLSYLYLDHNLLTGSIPESIGKLTSMAELYLGSNKLEGTIPSSIGNLKNMYQLFLYQTQISGPLPDSIGDLKELTQLILFENQLSGPIPKSIGNLKKLALLYLDTNKFSGEVPTEEINNLSQLYQLTLSYNEELYGRAPDQNIDLDTCFFFETLLCYDKSNRNNKCVYPEKHMDCTSCAENSTLKDDICQCDKGFSGIGYIECSKDEIEDIDDADLLKEEEKTENTDKTNENTDKTNENTDKTNENTDNTNEKTDSTDKANENKENDKATDNKDNKENDSSSSSSKIKIINTLNLLLVFVALVLLKN